MNKQFKVYIQKLKYTVYCIIIQVQFKFGCVAFNAKIPLLNTLRWYELSLSFVIELLVDIKDLCTNWSGFANLQFKNLNLVVYTLT